MRRASRALTPDAVRPSKGPISAEIEVSAIAQRDERALLGLEALQCVDEVDATDLVRRVGRAGIGRVQGQLDEPPPTTTPDDVASLVGSDRHEPGAQTVGLAYRAQLAPSDHPGRLDRVEGKVSLAADAVGDADHVRVVGVDDTGEGGLVARGRLLQHDRHRLSRCQCRHTREKLRTHVAVAPRRVFRRSATGCADA